MSENYSPPRTAAQRTLAEAATPELAGNAARLWGARNSTPQPIRAVQNFVFGIERPAGSAILRLTHESHRSAEEVEAELRWMVDLKQRELPVPAVYPSLRENLVEMVESPRGRFVASCFERLSGAKPDPKNAERWNDRMFESLGVVIAQLHQASYDARWTQATLARRVWREESVAQNFHFHVPVGDRAVHDAFDRVLAKLDQLPRSRDSFGLIHADLNHANFFITPAGLNLFDFDDSCYCWFAYDLLVPIFHFPTADQAAMDARAQHALRLLLRGYERVRRFNRIWLEYLPLLCKWRDLLTYGFLYEQLEIAELPEEMRITFLAMRARIEADRPIAEFSAAG